MYRNHHKKHKTFLYLSMDLVHSANLPRLGPVLSTIGSYM